MYILIRVGTKVGQIGPKWENLGLFQTSFQFVFARFGQIGTKWDKNVGIFKISFLSILPYLSHLGSM